MNEPESPLPLQPASPCRPTDPSRPPEDADILAIMNELNETRLPPGGLEQVLAAVRAARLDAGAPAAAMPSGRAAPEETGRTATPAAGGKILTMPRRRWMAGAAACLAAGTGGLLWMRSRPGSITGSGTPSVESFADAVCRKATGRILLAHSSASVAAAGAWLQERAAPLSSALTALASAKALGCQRYLWEGQEVSLICLAAGGGITHLFSVARSAVPDILSAPATPLPPRQLHGLQTTHFADVECLTVIVGSKPEVDVREIADLIV